jgi:hypothetical protein
MRGYPSAVVVIELYSYLVHDSVMFVNAAGASAYVCSWSHSLLGRARRAQGMSLAVFGSGVWATRQRIESH